MSRSPRSIAVFVQDGGGHLSRALPLVDGLARRGCDVHIYGRADARDEVERAGGIFHDLYSKFPIEEVDAESIPMPSRFVTYAATYAEPVAALVRSLNPSLVVYDTFAVIAPVVARLLNVPYIGIRAGHAQTPERARVALQNYPHIVTSAACLAAVERLRTVHGLPDADPFLYLDGLSPWLNLYPEPPEFLPTADHRAFEPVAFFGTLTPELRERASTKNPPTKTSDGPRPTNDQDSATKLKVYASFGTVIWRYFERDALAALDAISYVLSSRGADVLISLGNATVDPTVHRSLQRPGVRVAPFVDQWSELKNADIFITHNGINSTHEAVYLKVPMLSYPFFGDQPLMSQRCAALGIGMRLTDVLRGSLDPVDVSRRIDRALAERPQMLTALARAKAWELRTLAKRDEVIDRILAIADASAVVTG